MVVVCTQAGKIALALVRARFGRKALVSYPAGRDNPRWRGAGTFPAGCLSRSAANLVAASHYLSFAAIFNPGPANGYFWGRGVGFDRIR